METDVPDKAEGLQHPETPDLEIRCRQART